jgi:hypothetical protein
MMIPEGKTELRHLRTLNSKHYDNGDGTTLGCFGVGHQCYKNKLGVGDSVGDFRSLDWTLTPVEGGGWTFLFHSFHPTVPQFADGWLTFRDMFDDKDQTVGFKPVCSHVEGRLVLPEALEAEGLDKLTGVNAVVYDSAFGDGIDYVVYFTRSQMKKCVRIKEASKQNQDYSFKFELELPYGVTMWRVGSDGSEYQFEGTSDKDFDSDKRTELRTAEGTTFFKPFQMWDSKSKETCVVSYSVEDGVKFLTKHVPAAFMESSEGDVFTDTTTSYYAGAGDGRTCSVLGLGTTWATLRSNGGTFSDYTAAQNVIVQGEEIATNDWDMSRGHFPVDTSGIGAGNTVSSASFKVFYSTAVGYLSTETINPANLALVASTAASNTVLANSDYAQVGTTRLCDTDVTIANFVSSDGTFALNATGVATVNTTGYTKFAFRSTNDFSDSTAPVVTKRSYVGACNSEYSGTAKDPILTVTYAATGTSTDLPRHRFLWR